MAVKREAPEAGPPPAKTYRKQIKTSALYSNDFTSLLASLDSLGEVTEVRCGESAVIESADDLKDVKPSERSDITITMSSPEIVLKLGQESSVRTSDPTSNRARETTDRIAGLFSTWASIRPRFMLPVWLIFPVGLGVPGVIAFLIGSAVRQEWVELEDPMGFVWVLLATSALPGIAGAFFAKTRVVVHPTSRFERTEQVRKFYGTLVIGVAGGVAGSLLTWFLALQDKK